MKLDVPIPEMMLAPCGMNCAVCYVHLKPKNPCMGCHGLDGCKPDHCLKCAIKDCATQHEVKFCGDCSLFPCMSIKRLDKSYRKRYNVSLIENAIRIKAVGVATFLAEERAKWTCQQCGGAISLHDGVCSDCGEKL